MQRARRAALHLAWHDRALLCTRDGALASYMQRRFINEDRDGSQMEELLERTVVRAPFLLQCSSTALLTALFCCERSSLRRRMRPLC
jgi:hypothetical protein